MQLPLRCSDVNRQDFLSILASITQQRGDSVTIVPGTALYIECYAEARLLYDLRMQNLKLQNQLDATTTTDFLPRWEAFLNLIPLPTDTLTDRRTRIANKIALINFTPTYNNIKQMLENNIPFNYATILLTNPTASISSFPGGSNIVGGENATNGNWYSNVSSIWIETYMPPWMQYSQFIGNIANLMNILNTTLPAYMTMDWFVDTFSDGYGLSTISVSAGSTTVTGIGTQWATVMNTVENIYMLVNGSIIETYDNLGNWQRLTVASIQSNTSLTLQSPAPSNITNKTYVVQGFFVDNGVRPVSTAFHYSPNYYNSDFASVNNV